MSNQTPIFRFDPNQLALEAREFFGQHYNCAQSSFAPFARHLGMDLDLAFKIATPFGGGMGHAGQICGAVSGALMAIGLARGITEYDQEQKYACYDLAKTFQERFKTLHGELTCPGLLGWDIANPHELSQVREEDLFHTLCPKLVGDAARIAGELLRKVDNL
ncbi:MAG: C-GCAxxG-C-C family protein [Brevefilum sp.]